MKNISETPIPENEKPPLILIVDDNKTNITMLKAIFSKEKINLILPAGGQEAIDTVQDVLPDLILLDIIMPDINGYEVCRIMKSPPRTEYIPIFFLRVNTEQNDIVKGFKAGAVDYLTKPFNSPELLAGIKTHLELKRLRQNQQKIISGLRNALKNVS